MIAPPRGPRGPAHPRREQVGQGDGHGVGRVALRGDVAQPVDACERRSAPAPCRRSPCRSPPASPRWVRTPRPGARPRRRRASTAPVARATCSALTWFRLHATRSSATAVGRGRRSPRRIASAICRRRSASCDAGRRDDVCRPTEPCAGRAGPRRRARNGPRRGPPRARRHRTSVRWSLGWPVARATTRNARSSGREMTDGYAGRGSG